MSSPEHEQPGEEPGVVTNREGRSLATLKTLTDSRDPDQAMVAIRVKQTSRGDELFNYDWSREGAVHSSGMAGDPPYLGEAAQPRLVDVLERLQLERDLV